MDEYGQHLKSHTSAIISLREAIQEIRNNAKEVNKIPSYLHRNSLNQSPKLDSPGQYLPSSPEEQVLAIEKQRAQPHEV